MMLLGPLAVAQAPRSVTLLAVTEQAEDIVGIAAVPAGDVDGDEIGDYIIGTGTEIGLPGIARDETVYVISGATDQVIWALESPNDMSDGYFGFSVAGAGDINADGHDDLIVGALRESAGNSPTRAGRAYVFSGATGNVIHILAAPVEDAYAGFGATVRNVGDVNGDGLPDIAVGTSADASASWSAQEAPAYVFSGASGLFLTPLNAPAFVEARTSAPSAPFLGAAL